MKRLDDSDPEGGSNEHKDPSWPRGDMSHDFKKGIAGFDTEGQRRRQAVGRWKARGFKSMAFVEVDTVQLAKRSLSQMS